MPLDAAALITAGASIANAAGSTAYNAASSKKQREWSEKMQKQQNEWSLNMWNKSNEYNSPSAQVERMREAGLNPLYYGLDGSSAGSLESAQPLGYERSSMEGIENPAAVALNARLAVAQAENVQANTAKQNQETLTEVQKREKLIAEIENTKQELNNLKSQEGLTDAQKAQIDKSLEWADRLNEATIAEKEANSKLNDSQKKRIDSLLDGEKILQSKSIEDFDYKWSKIRAEIQKMSKETGLLAKDIENYALNHANNGFMGTGLSLPNLIRAVKSNGVGVNWSDNDSDALNLARSGQ